MTSYKLSHKRIGQVLGLLALGLVLLVGSSGYGQSGADPTVERVTGTTGINGSLNVTAPTAGVRIIIDVGVDCSRAPHTPLAANETVTVDVVGVPPTRIDLYARNALVAQLRVPEDVDIQSGNPTIIRPKKQAGFRKVCFQAGPPAPGRKVLDPANAATSDAPLPAIAPVPGLTAPVPGLTAVAPPGPTGCGCVITKVTITVDPPLGDNERDKRTNKPKRLTKGYHVKNTTTNLVDDPLETVVTIRIDTNEQGGVLDFNLFLAERTLYVVTPGAVPPASGIDLGGIAGAIAQAYFDDGTEEEIGKKRSCLRSPIIIKAHVYDLILRKEGRPGSDVKDNPAVQPFINTNAPTSFYIRTRMNLTIDYENDPACPGGATRTIPITYELGPIPMRVEAERYHIDSPTVPVARGPLARWHP